MTQPCIVFPHYLWKARASDTQITACIAIRSRFNDKTIPLRVSTDQVDFVIVTYNMHIFSSLTYHTILHLPRLWNRQFHLILARSSLTSFQLVQIPSANLHVSSVLVQALREAFGVGLTASSPPAVVLVSSVLSLLCYLIACLLSFHRGTARTTTEEAADGVAYTGADCYTTIKCKRLFIAFTLVMCWGPPGLPPRRRLGP